MFYRLWRGDAVDLLERELPPSTSCDEASERKKLSERALQDLDLVLEDTWTRRVGCRSLISHQLFTIWRDEAHQVQNEM